MMFPKQKRQKSRSCIDKIRSSGKCEKCGSEFGLEVHHIKSRGAWGSDTEDNLVCLCYVCHRKVHDGNISRDELREIVRRRENG